MLKFSDGFDLSCVLTMTLDIKMVTKCSGSIFLQILKLGSEFLNCIDREAKS